LTHALWRGADALVDLGQSPSTIDSAMRDWGMALPPYQLADQIGLGMVAPQHRADGARNWSAVLTAQGRTGRMAGDGFYGASDTPPLVDPAILLSINSLRPAKPDLPAHQIRQLLVGAMANEAARALRDAVVAQASDVDLVSIFTGVLPHWSGGILHHARNEGLLQISRAMTALPHPDTDFWTPDPIFADLIKQGRGFDDPV
jgi:3-hydroxyacyl-CoA dehydrogenase